MLNQFALVVQSNSPNPEGVLGDTDKETFSSISITKNPFNEKLHIQMPYLHTGGVCFQFKSLSTYI